MINEPRSKFSSICKYVMVAQSKCSFCYFKIILKCFNFDVLFQTTVKFSETSQSGGCIVLGLINLHTALV